MIRLKIKGFNSFFEEQIIDFDGLTNVGIFGIFGPTGSGKSSIIDAVTFALYGNVARYENEERRAFINSNSKSASVVFEFALSLVAGKMIFYEVSREIKKNKSGSISHNARLVKKNDGNIEIVSEKAKNVTENIIKIIGLDYKDFIRSVVLPQGKFSEFLMLKNIERRNMLERIFGLEKYGTYLNEAINEKRKNQIKIVDDINSKLEVFVDISEEFLNRLKKEMEEKNSVIEKYRRELNEKRDIFEKYKAFIILKKEFDDYVFKENKLKKQKKVIELKKIKLNEGKRAEKVYPFITEYKKSLENFNISVLKLEKANKKFEIIENKFLLKKKEYDEFMLNKKIQYPIIIKKETEINKADEIKKYIDKIEEERQNLLKEYKSAKSKFLKIESDCKKEIIEKNIAEKNINDIEIEKEKIVVLPDYRKNIEYAWNLEKKFYELSQKYDLEIIENKKFSENVKNEKLKIKTKEKDIDVLEKESFKLKEKKNEFLKKNNFSVSDIIEMQKENEEIKNLLLIKKEKYNKYLNLKNELENTEKNKTDYDEKYNEILKEEDKNNKEIFDIDEKIKLVKNKEFIKELVLNLKDDTPCPICGSIHHPMPTEIISDNILDELNIQKDNLKEKKLKLLEIKNDIFSKIAVLKSDIKKLKSDIEKIKNELGNFDFEKENLYMEKNNREFKEIKNNFEFYNKKIKEIEENENKTIFELNKLKLDLAQLKTEREKDCENLEKSERLIKSIMEEKSLAENKLDDLRKKFDVDDFEKEYLKLVHFENKKSLLEKEEKENRNIYKEKQENIDKLKIEMGEYEKIIEKVKILGTEKKEIIEKNNKEFQEICNGKNFDEYKKEIFEKKVFFDENESLIQNNIDKITIQRNTFFEDKIKTEKEKDTLEEIKNNMLKKLQAVALENDFNNVDDAEKSYITKYEIDIIEKEIDAYNDVKKEISSNLKKLSLKIEKSEVLCDDNDVNKLKKEIDLLTENIEITINETGQIKNKIIEAEDSLKKSEELKKQLKIHQHKLDVIISLFNTMKGGRFIEFISKRQLHYITMDASERLKKITNGRYAIELDGDDFNENKETGNYDVANFVIRDDFNGGTRRIPKSLSGGEVFLTSLSLALALSSKIQLKNNAPLETFFLDEGFGSLDSYALDAVMDSLEKLSTEKINVGIITHVEEIKNRIQSKIIVEPPDGIDGTKIKVEKF